MEDKNKLNIFEVKALLTFLKENINRTNLPIDGSMPRLLFLAFLKLQNYADEWDEKMSYTE